MFFATPQHLEWLRNRISKLEEYIELVERMEGRPAADEGLVSRIYNLRCSLPLYTDELRFRKQQLKIFEEAKGPVALQTPVNIHPNANINLIR